MKLLLWLLLGGGLLAMLCCGGLLAFVGYIGAYGPETSVYTGNQVPSRFVETMKEVGALDDGEQILYFYSDAMTDIRDGFYFVSDQKVVIYSDQASEDPLQLIAFDQIAETELFRNESFFEDSEITLNLKNGEIRSFPVSSELDKDVKFHEAIRERMQ